MVGDPMKSVLRETVGGIQFAVAVVNGGNVVFQTKLELSNRIEQSRRDAPHAVHVLYARIVEAYEAAVSVGSQGFFGTEVLDISGEENTLQFLRVFVFLRAHFTTIHDTDP